MKKTHAIIKLVVLALGLFYTIKFQAQVTTQTFTFTGSLQTFTVPSGVASMSITAAGASGVGMNGFVAGNGGVAFGVLAVTPGQVLNIYVGGTNAFNGGGIGLGGANGGGASDVRVGGTALANRVIVAGGGGGAGGDNWICLTGTGHGGGGSAVGTNFVGGAGGAGYSSGTGCGANGGNAGGAGGTGTHGGGGGGGGLTTGGSGAASSIGTAVAGTLGQGGASYNSASCGATGGGGGGYYGGGGAAGNNCGAGRGGGGSSWTGTCTSPSFTAGTQVGNGQVVITYNANGANISGPLNSGSSNLTFSYTGSVQNYTVPTCVNSITFNVQGAKGGAGTPITSSGGNGGGVVGIMTVTPGQVLQIYVGGIGSPGNVSAFATGGFNGGGAGGFYSGSYAGGSGGGASDIRVSPYALANRLVVAGGGGGGAYNSSTTDYDRGGRGGTTIAEAGLSGNVSGGTAPGGGGGPSSGGGPGFWSGYCTATAGSLGNGGPGGTCSNSGGGGGGGYYGGGGGVWAGGGGGSNYTDPSITGVTHTQGVNSSSGIVSFTLGVNGNLINNIVATPSVLCAGGTVTLSASGLTSYTWSSVSGNISSTASVAVTPSVSSNYTVMATNSVGCVSGYSIFVYSNSLPTISVNSGTICSGGTFTLVPLGGITYTYSGGSNTVAPLSNNIYTVTGSNTVGCVATALSSVTVVALPVVSVSSGTMCMGSNYTIAPSGANTYTYSSGTNVVSPGSNTNYSVTGTATTGCVSLPAPLTVSVAPLPTVTVNSGVICSGNIFTITPAGAFNYSINTGGTGTSFTVSPASTLNYSITGTSSVGCASSSNALSSVTVNISPTITVSSGTLCSNNTYSIVASGASTYTYSSGSATVTPLTTSSYSVTGTSSLGCIGTNTAISTVTVYITPTLVVNSGQICIGQIFTINPTGANSYTYSNGSATVSPISSSSYSITGTSIQGCAAFNTVVSNVTVNPTPTITVNSGTICLGQSYTLSPSGANTYTFSNGNAVVSPTINASYTITGTSIDGCVSPSAISSVTVYTLPSINVVNTHSTICSGESNTLTASGAASYSWSSGSTLATAVISPTVTSSYSVVGTSTDGCSSSTVVSQNVDLCTGISAITKSVMAEVSLFPNPNNGFFEISISDKENVSVEIYTMLGQRIMGISKLSDKTAINLSDFDNGIYLIRVIKQDKVIATQKMIKQ